MAECSLGPSDEKDKPVSQEEEAGAVAGVGGVR